MRQSVPVALLAALPLLAAAPAFAQGDFYGRTMGTFSFEDAEPPLLSGTIEQFFIEFESPVVFDLLNISFEITRHDDGPDSLIGAVTFLGANPADTLSGVVSGITFPNKDGVWTGGGDWTADTGAGAFAGLSGHGSFTLALFIGKGAATTSFEGTLIPAPAPAVLLVAALPAVTRRRRAAI